jgi:hypothetical protein
MKPHLPRLWLWASLLAFASQGCGAIWSGRAPYREDPLLLARKPTTGKPEEAKPVQLAYSEPSLPSLPAFAYVYPPQKPRFGAHEPALADHRPLPSESSKKTLTSSSIEAANPQTPGEKADARIQASPVMRRKVSGTFGHAPDFSWLQGVVRKSSDGHWELQFSESSAAGRVVLADDPRLEQLQDGDVIQLEGSLSVETPGTYRVDRMSRVR